MGAAVGSYSVLVMALGASWVILGSAPWLSFGYLGGSLIACAVAWLAGEVRAVARLRILSYASPLDGGAAPAAGEDRAGQDGGAAR
jgi:hypothetical protein